MTTFVSGFEKPQRLSTEGKEKKKRKSSAQDVNSMQSPPMGVRSDGGRGWGWGWGWGVGGVGGDEAAWVIQRKKGLSCLYCEASCDRSGWSGCWGIRVCLVPYQVRAAGVYTHTHTPEIPHIQLHYNPNIHNCYNKANKKNTGQLNPTRGKTASGSQ